jgi:DNA adenine methylase
MTNTQSRTRRIEREELRGRAAKPMSATPRAFLRWAGSKRYLLSHLAELVPEEYGRYYEPFLGSGSLYFLLRPAEATLSDACSELIRCFAAVRDDPDRIIEWFAGKRPDKHYFYELRSNRSEESTVAAAEFIYLNKTCWNGLYRVNSAGDFNVPFGRPKTDYLIDPDLIRSCSTCLREARLFSGDFEAAVEDAAAGDFAFFDPPYVTRHNNNGFVDYNQRLFSWDDQLRLAERVRLLRERGVHVVIANAMHSEVKALYKGFGVRPIARFSTLASDSRFRGPVEEALYFSK